MILLWLHFHQHCVLFVWLCTCHDVPVGVSSLLHHVSPVSGHQIASLGSQHLFPLSYHACLSLFQSEKLNYYRMLS